MKLRKLTINNIASIQDAEIDFDGELLGNTDLFLIAGPTGSGKSTILDAICLALFNSTPRIVGASKEAIVNQEGGEEMKTSSPLNLIRKHAVNASVVLTFQGSDGHEYTARWVMTRGNQFKGGKLNQVFLKEGVEANLKRPIKLQWSVTDDTTAQTHENATDVKNVIAHAIGMEFDEFSKTTMLAQGEFTKFLASEPEKKVKILERLVGTEIYGNVGAKINAITNEKAAAVKQAQALLENCKLLSSEEIAAHQVQIGLLDAEIQQFASQIAALDKKITYIAAKKKIDSDLLNAQEQLATATDALNADDAKGEQYALNLWDNTQDLRTAIGKKATLETEAAQLAEKRKLYSQDYAQGIAAIAVMESVKAEFVKKIEAEQAELERQEPYREMYGKVDVICTTHDNVEEWKKFIALNTPTLQKYGETLTALGKEKEEAEKQKSAAQEEIAKLEGQQDVLNNQLQDCHADALPADIANNAKRQTDLNAVKTALDVRNEAEIKYAQSQKDAEADKLKIAELQEQLAAVDKARNEAEKAYNERKQLYDKMRESVGDHARILRANLHKGDKCPVCGQQIDEIVSDESLMQLLRPLEDSYKADEKAWEDAKTSCANAKAALDTAVKTYEKSLKTVATDKANFEAKCKDLTAKCLKVGIEDGRDIALQISEKEAEILAKAQDLDLRQKTVAEIRKQIESIAAEMRKIRTQRVETADKSIKALAEDIEDAQSKMDTLKGQIDGNAASIIAGEKAMDEMINRQWQAPEGSDFFVALKQAAKLFADTELQIEKDERQLQTIASDLEHMLSCRKSVLALVPAWIEIPADSQSAVQNGVTHWTELQANCANLENLEHKNAEQQSVNARFIEDTMAQHPDWNMEEIVRIAAMTDIQILTMRTHVETLNQAYSNAQTLMQDIQRRQAELLPVEIAEEETSEALETSKAQISQASSEKSQQVGAIKQKLEADEALRREYGESKRRLDEMRDELDEWKFLDSYLGSTNGKNFRSVAQSFILGDLLEKANAYLSKISDRYTLFCRPGTLTILLKDSEQGDEVRPTTTLSGGESFIVSLALALGLSSMHSAGFEVDTLFIDEGFGTLSPEYLDPVIQALKRLYDAYGRRVGIISHVESLRSRIPVCIQVSKQGTNPSKVEITAYGQ